ERVHVALCRPIAARRVGIETAARLDSKVCCLLHRLHGEVFGRLDDDSALTTDPGDDRGPVFVVMPPARAHTSCVDTAGDGLAALVRLVWLGPCAHRCGRDHPLPLCLSSGDRSRRRRQYSAATSTSDNWSDHGRPALEQYAATNTTDRAEMSPGSNVIVIAYSGGAGYQ